MPCWTGRMYLLMSDTLYYKCSLADKNTRFSIHLSFIFCVLSPRYGIRPESVIVYGQSIGTVPSVDLASRYESAAVILHSPLTSGMRVAFPDTKKTYCFDAFPKWVDSEHMTCENGAKCMLSTWRYSCSGFKTTFENAAHCIRGERRTKPPVCQESFSLLIRFSIASPAGHLVI